MNWRFWKKQKPLPSRSRYVCGEKVYTGTPSESLAKTLDQGDHSAANLFADLCQQELYEAQAERRQQYIEEHGQPPPVNYSSTEADAPIWQVAEAEAIERYGYVPPEERAAYYRNRIQANTQRLK